MSGSARRSRVDVRAPNAVAVVLLALVVASISAARVSGATNLEDADTKIAFDRVGNGTSAIYVMNADGTSQRKLTKGRAYEAAPAWSPDGQEIAFERASGGRNVEIYVMSADGSDLRRLTRNLAVDGGAAWSPNGTTIAFASTRRRGHREIYLMNADGSDQLGPLTSDSRPDGGPTWSSDGRRIAFWSQSAAKPGATRIAPNEIYVMDADGSDERNLTRSTANDSSPAWSPDGRRIAFTSGPRAGVLAGYDVYVMNADGSGLQRLTRSPGYDASPAWSPDGRRIAFVSGRDGNNEIYVMNADGSGQQRLTRNRVRDQNPSWQAQR